MTARAGRLVARAGVVGVTVGILISGCSGTAGPSDDPDPQTPSSTRAAEPGAEKKVENSSAPEPGTCWRVPPPRDARDYWFDDSPAVPCARRHTNETVLVYDLGKPTPEEASELGSLCLTQVRVYVGSDLTHWVPWAAALFLPSRDQVERGESWARCDYTMFADTSFGTKRAWRTGSAKDAIYESPADVWACVNDERLTRGGGVAPFVDCREPHLLEATGNLTQITGLSGYPSTRELTAAEGPCLGSLTDAQRNEGLAVNTVWDSPAILQDNTELYGVCWKYRVDGKPLPPMN